MIIHPPSANHVAFLGLNIYYYSICMFIAVFVSCASMNFFINRLRLNVDKDVVLDFCPPLIIFAVIGARLYYVLLSLDYFLLNPKMIFMVWAGGISIHGAFLGGLIFALFYFKKHKLKFFPYADLVALVFPLGQAIGRWGNFFNSEAFGVPVKNFAPIMLYVEEQFRPKTFFDSKYFHPAFLYESILDFLVFIFLFFLLKKTANKIDGLVFYSYIVLYSIVRLILEFFRLDTVFYVGFLPFPSLVSLIAIFIGIFGIVFRIKAKTN